MNPGKNLETGVLDSLRVYSSYKRSLLANFLGMVATNANPGPRDVNRMRLAFDSIRQSFAEQLDEAIEKAFDSLIETAYNTVFDIPLAESPLTSEQIEVLDTFVGSLTDRVIVNIQQQMMSDVAQTLTLFKRFLVQIQLKESQKGLSRGNAIESEKHRMFMNLETYRRDSLGRKRDTEQFALTELRFAIYHAFNICMIYMLSVKGDTEAYAVRPSKSWIRFNLDEFENMQEEIFHPHSLAIVLPIDSNQ